MNIILYENYIINITKVKINVKKCKINDKKLFSKYNNNPFLF